MNNIRQEIEEHIPTLIKLYKETYKSAETLRKAFVRDYSYKRIQASIISLLKPSFSSNIFDLSPVSYRVKLK